MYNPPLHNLKVLNYVWYRSRVPNSTSSEDESQTKKRKVVAEIHSPPPKPAPRYHQVESSAESSAPGINSSQDNSKVNYNEHLFSTFRHFNCSVRNFLFAFESLKDYYYIKRQIIFYSHGPSYLLQEISRYILFLM